jgi:uncharacterized protein (TIGR00299 family) protein
MKLLYLDCSAGASGDMLLGALLDAGAEESAVRACLERLGIDGWELGFERVQRAGVDAGKARVTTAPSTEHRDLATIKELLMTLDDPIRSGAIRTFEALAEAEATVHRMSVDSVHFHEVGALDAIVDVVGTWAALQDLAIDRVVCSAVPHGSGTVEAAHGTLPVPAPATLELVKRHQVPVVAGGEGEAVTPTGAALIAMMAHDFGDIPALEITHIGYGAGDRDTQRPNVVRALIGDVLEIPTTQSHVLIETNIDDMTPELLPYAIDALIRAGADDAWITPIQMKKRRPGFLLSVLVHRERRTTVMDTLFRETTTLGCRIVPTTKEELDRSWVQVDVDGHPVRIKIAQRAGKVVTMAPEYEDAVKVARSTGAPLKDVYERALELARTRSTLL